MKNMSKFDNSHNVRDMPQIFNLVKLKKITNKSKSTFLTPPAAVNDINIKVEEVDDTSSLPNFNQNNERTKQSDNKLNSIVTKTYFI